MKKSIFFLLLISVLAVMGCAEEKQTSQTIVGSPTVPSESEQLYANDGVQQVQITGPVTYRFDRHRQWREEKTEVLEDKVGKYVSLHCYDVTCSGQLEEINGSYAVLSSNDYDEIYVSIDSISLLG